MDAELTETSYKHSLLTDTACRACWTLPSLWSLADMVSPSLGHFPSCTMSSVASPYISCHSQPSWSSFLLLKKHPMGDDQELSE